MGKSMVENLKKMYGELEQIKEPDAVQEKNTRTKKK